MVGKCEEAGPQRGGEGGKARGRPPSQGPLTRSVGGGASAHLKPNALGHLPKHKLRDAAKPHPVEALVVFVRVVSSIAICVGSEVVQFTPRFFGVNAEVERDVVGAVAEQIEEPVRAVDHGKGGAGTRPRGDDGKPAAPVVFFKPERELAFGADESAGFAGELNFEGRRCFVQQIGGRKHGKRGLEG